MNAADDDDGLARLLIRSARLDIPAPEARMRARARGVRALEEPRRRARRWGTAVLGLAAAAGAALAVRMHSAVEDPLALAPERIHDVPAGTATAPGGTATAPGGTATAPGGTATAPGGTATAPAVTPCPALVVAHGIAPLIDDFERPDAWILAADGRRGSWVTYDDGTGLQSPPSHSALLPTRIPGGRGASRHALHVTGTHFTKWGVTFGTELADAACYDAAAYSGVRFWAKGPGEVRVGLQMIDVQDAKHGGLCTADCYDTHRKIVELAPSFREYRIRWDELAQLYTAGRPVAFDPKRVRFLEFGVAPEHTPFDLWIDDVQFFR